MDLPPTLPMGQGTPLNPIPPERANIQRTPLAQSQSFNEAQLSPSGTSILSSGNLPDRVSRSHFRSGSEILDKVAKFDRLSQHGADWRKLDDAALKRALVGREEAEDEVRALRDESKRCRMDLEEEKRKTARVAVRLEDVTDSLHETKQEVHQLKEELHRTKERESTSQNQLEKEARKAKKEAFKYSSAYVKLQEELKATRLSFRVLQSDLESQTQKAEKYAEEAFAAEYKLVGVQEQLTSSKERIKVVEEERDSLKMHLKEEEVARIAAEGRIALPISKEDEEFGASPVKSTLPDSFGSPLVVPARDEIAPDSLSISLAEELEWERACRFDAEQAIEYLKMECQFRACSCRVAERNGTSPYIFDHDAEETMGPILKIMHQHIHPAPKDEPLFKKPERRREPGPASPSEDPELGQEAFRPQFTFSESTGTFRSAQTPSDRTHDSFAPRNPAPAVQLDTISPTLTEETSLLSLLSAPVFTSHSHPQALDSHPDNSSPDISTHAPRPYQPRNHPSDPRIQSQSPTYHQRSYTTTIPLAPIASPTNSINTSAPSANNTILDSESSVQSQFSPPTTISREKALEQIRQRRGRARSMAHDAAAAGAGIGAVVRGMSTPKRQVDSKAAATPANRRDISAPAVRSVGRIRSREMK